MNSTHIGLFSSSRRAPLSLSVALALFLAGVPLAVTAHAQDANAPAVEMPLSSLPKLAINAPEAVTLAPMAPTSEAVLAEKFAVPLVQANAQLAPPTDSLAPANIAPNTTTPAQPLVTNSFTDTDIKQALSDVAAQTGVSIIPDSTVQGTITLDLKDVPLERALRMMLQAGGFSFAQMDGYYLVGSAEPTNPNFYLFSHTEFVQLHNIRPEVVLSLLAVPYGRYLSSEGPTPIVTARGGSGDDGRRSVGGGLGNYGGGNQGADSDIGRPAPTYKIAITASPTMITRIKADIARLDQQRQQVMLEALVLEISQDDLKNLGFNFASKYFSLNTTGGNGGNTFAYSSVSRDQLVQIAALSQRGAVRVRANPRVATGDGQTADMEVGRENYFSITSGALNYAYNTLEVIRSGISLRITPRILEDGNEVTALVEPEVRDVTGNTNNGLPEITFRRAATNVRVKDGESIVIGGLINEFTSNTKSKIPILGDLPLVGGLFRGTNSRQVRTETVIIITPRILRDDDILVRDGIQSPALRNDLQAYRNNNRRNPLAAPATAVPGKPVLPPFVAPEPGVPEPGAPVP